MVGRWSDANDWFTLVLLLLSPVLLSLASPLHSVAAQPVTITVLAETGFWNAEMLNWLEEEYLPHFQEENPDIRVEILRANGWGDRQEQLVAMIAGGVAPDIVVMGHTHFMVEGVGKGWQLPLNDYLAEWEDTDAYLPAAWAHATNYGKTYGVAQAATSRAIAYNKRHFAEAGLDPETPPSTWEEMIEYSRRLLRTTDQLILRRGLHLVESNQGIAQDFQMYMFANDGQILAEDLRTPVFNETRGIETLSFMQQLYAINNPQHLDDGLSTSTYTGFMTEESSMVRSSPNLGGRILNEFPDVAEVLGVFPVPPRTTAQSPSSAASINGAGLLRFTEHPDEAWRVLAALMSREVTEHFIRLAGHVSTRRDILPFIAEHAPILRPWYEAMAIATPFPSWPSGAGYSYSDALGEPVRQAVRGETSIRAALDEAERRVKIMVDAFWESVQATR